MKPTKNNQRRQLCCGCILGKHFHVEIASHKLDANYLKKQNQVAGFKKSKKSEGFCIANTTSEDSPLPQILLVV